VKVYSRRQARELFSMFGEVRTEVKQLRAATSTFLDGSYRKASCARWAAALAGM